MHEAMRGYVRKARKLLTVNNGVLAIAVGVAALWVWSTVQAIQHNFALQQEVDALRQQVTLEDLQNRSLELQKNYYNTDQYLELSARERLNLANPDEKVLILPPNTVAPASDVLRADGAEPVARSNFAQWMYFLFGAKQ